MILFHLLPAAILLPLWSAAPGMGPFAEEPGFGMLVGLLALWLVPAATLGQRIPHGDPVASKRGPSPALFAHARPWWFFAILLPVLAFPLFWAPAL